MSLIKLTWDDLLAKFRPDIAAGLERLAALEGTDGICVFECLQLDSSALGSRTAVAYGPSRTFKTIDACRDGHLNDLPSQRQYATSYWPKEKSA